jgi:hypothetical protein
MLRLRNERCSMYGDREASAMPNIINNENDWGRGKCK